MLVASGLDQCLTCGKTVVNVPRDLFNDIQRRLHKEREQPLSVIGNSVEKAKIIHRRATVADALGGGEPGMLPVFWRLPYGEPAWVDVPAGEFEMGGVGQYDGKPVHCVYLNQFKIGRVPITNAQYRIFVEAANYKSPEHWNGGTIPRGYESHPVVHVTWHAALAYCRWLSELTGESITLPSEAQWEKAARGCADQRSYPWGNEWDVTKCNNNELDIGETTPAGIFLEGASPYGCLDMSGNVWEWTTTHYDFKYPYRVQDGREKLEAGGDVVRVLRGGSFFFNLGHGRCASRHRLNSSYSGWDLGFRVVSASILSSSAV